MRATGQGEADAARGNRGVHAEPRRGMLGRLPIGARRLLWPLLVAAVVAVLVTGVIVVVQPTGPTPAPAATQALDAPTSTSPQPGARSATTPAATTSPTGATPTPTPTAKPTTGRPVAPAAPAATSKRKGVGVWTFDGVSQALANSGASWYYTWDVAHPGVTSPEGRRVRPDDLGGEERHRHQPAPGQEERPYLLGFNEPDLKGQAEMTVEQALELWPQLQATGLPLGSPAVAWGGDRPGEWLDRFMAGAKQRGYRVDFIALHWYGGDFTTANAVNQLKSYLQAVHDRYKLPIWLTEFALIDFSNGVRFPTQAQQAAFLTAATRMLGGLSWLQRYAWFGLPATDKDQTGLFRTGSTATAVGRAYQAAR